MLMVIFGAGASHDSIASKANDDDAAQRPPLAAHLFNSSFDAYARAHRASGALVNELRQKVATIDLETELDRIQSQDAPNSPTRRRELLALRYYLRDLLWEVGEKWEDAFAPGQTNYHILLQRIELWRERQAVRTDLPSVVLVSFNYDTILDGAVRDVLSNPLQSVEQYMRSRRGVPLFKPHGSVNWIRVVGDDGDMSKYDGGQDGFQRLAQARMTELALLEKAASDNLDPQDDFHVVPDRLRFLTPGNRVGMPALTIPVLSKASFEFPSEHQRLLVKIIPEVKWLLIVGWRATEKNFLALWTRTERKTQPRLQIVNKSKESADATRAALRDAGIRESEYVPYDNGFSWYLGDPGLLDRFLNEPFPGLG